MNTFTRLCCIGAAAFGLSSFSIGAETAVSHSDKSFFEKAAKSGAEEVAVSRAALPHLNNAQAREFAQMMVTDHTGANDELKALAAKKGVELPAKQPDTDKWSKSKKDYDIEYIKKMVSDHEDAVDLFTKTSKKADDAEVQAFAAKTLPTLQHHLTLAKDIKAALK